MVEKPLFMQFYKEIPAVLTIPPVKNKVKDRVDIVMYKKPLVPV